MNLSTQHSTNVLATLVLYLGGTPMCKTQNKTLEATSNPERGGADARRQTATTDKRRRRLRPKPTERRATVCLIQTGGFVLARFPLGTAPSRRRLLGH